MVSPEYRRVHFASNCASRRSIDPRLVAAVLDSPAGNRMSENIHHHWQRYWLPAETGCCLEPGRPDPQTAPFDPQRPPIAFNPRRQVELATAEAFTRRRSPETGNFPTAKHAMPARGGDVDDDAG